MSPLSFNLLSYFKFGHKKDFSSSWGLLQPLICSGFLLGRFPLFPHILFGTCPPSFIVELTLATSCPCSDPLFLVKVQLLFTLTLPSYDLVMWTNGFVLFLLVKAVLSLLLIGHFVVLMPPFPFWQAHCDACVIF